MNVDFHKTSTHLRGQTKCLLFQIADEIASARLVGLLR